MSVFENNLGISVAASKLQITEVAFTDDKFIVESVDEEYFEDFIDFDDKETKIISVLQRAFNEINLRKPLKSSNVSFTLPHDFFYILRIPFDKTLINADQINHLKWEFSVCYPHINVDDLLIQKIETLQSEFIPQDSIIAFGLNRKRLKILTSFCSQNKLKLKFVDNSHFSSDICVSLNENIGEGEIIMTLFIGDLYLSIEFLRGSTPFYFKAAPLNHAGEIIPAIKNEFIPRADLNINPKSVSRIYAYGEDLSSSILEQLRSALNMRIIRVDPFEKVYYNPDLNDSKLFVEKKHNFTFSAGAAYRMA